MLERLKARAQGLRTETMAIYFAYRDPRTPWLAKGIAMMIVAYALSPIDLIPDFIPVLGYLDDLIIVPLGITLVVRMIPKEIMVSSREKAKAALVQNGSIRWLGLVLVVFAWLGLLALVILLTLELINKSA